MGQPEELAVAGTDAGQGWGEDGPQSIWESKWRGRVGGESLFGDFFDGGHAGPSPVVAEEVAGDAEEVAAAVEFAIEGSGGAEEADEALLHEVVGEGGIAGDSGEVGPEGAGGALIEGGEGVAGHCACVRCGGLRGVADGCAGEREDVVPVHRVELRVDGVRAWVTDALLSRLASQPAGLGAGGRSVRRAAR